MTDLLPSDDEFLAVAAHSERLRLEREREGERQGRRHSERLASERDLEAKWGYENYALAREFISKAERSALKQQKVPESSFTEGYGLSLSLRADGLRTSLYLAKMWRGWRWVRYDYSNERWMVSRLDDLRTIDPEKLRKAMVEYVHSRV